MRKCDKIDLNLNLINYLQYTLMQYNRTATDFSVAVRFIFGKEYKNYTLLSIWLSLGIL